MPEDIFKYFKFSRGGKKKLEGHNQREKLDFFDYTFLQRFNFVDILYNKTNLIY